MSPSVGTREIAQLMGEQPLTAVIEQVMADGVKPFDEQIQSIELSLDKEASGAVGARIESAIDELRKAQEAARQASVENLARAILSITDQQEIPLSMKVSTQWAAWKGA